MKIFVPMLAMLFIGLKLTGLIAWSWFWVLCPLWIGFAIAAFIVLFTCIVIGVKIIIETWK